MWASSERLLLFPARRTNPTPIRFSAQDLQEVSKSEHTTNVGTPRMQLFKRQGKRASSSFPSTENGQDCQKASKTKQPANVTC